MDEALTNALSAPDIDDTLLAAVEHADLTMRKYIWRGFKPIFSSSKGELIADGKSAGDFVNEALRRFCSGKRAYNPKRTLLENLNSATDSIVWSDKKTSDRNPLIDFAPPPEGAEDCPDPITAAPAANPNAAELQVMDEESAAQAQFFGQIRASFDGDRETQDYLDALAEEFYDAEEISEVTGIPVPRIYEIRRKLKKNANRLFGVTNLTELKRKLETPANESKTQSAT
jgi:hypothetical protein